MQQGEHTAMDAAADAGMWFPLSEAQLSRWFLYQRDPARQGSHNIGFCVRVHAALPAAPLQTALQRMVDRHPMLRAQFRDGIDGPEQTIAARVDVAVHGVLAATDAADLVDRVRVDCRQAFDLSQAPLIRAHLYRVGDAETVLLLVMDHLVADGWSYWQILDELDGLLREPAADVPTQMPAATYADYVRWQREWRCSAAAETQSQYWRQTLAGELPLLQLPLRAGDNGGGEAAAQPETGSVVVCVAPALATALSALSRAQAGTLFTTLLAAYQVLLHRHSGQDDIIVGSPMPGRSRGQWDRVVGDFVNPVAIRTRFAADIDVATLLKQVRNSTLRAMTHQDLPFGQLVERLQPPRGTEHPVFQTLFTLQKSRGNQRLLSLWDARAETTVEWGGHAVSAFPAIAGGAGGDFMLALDVIELDDTIRCDFSFDAARIDAASVERMAGHFIRLLQAFVADPQQRVADIDMLAAGERAELLRDLNETAVSFPRGTRVHDAFERQAAATPESTALCDAATTLSYRELNRRANRVAHRLLALGVRPDDRVAICVDRSVDMVVGLLGILKAGAAYVPLDPSLPAQRLGYIVSDSAPVAVLVQSTQRDRLPAHPSPALLLDDPADAAPDATADADPVGNDLHAHHLAYVMYTSGSTGAPKGVMVEHANVVNLIHTHIHHCEMVAGDAVLQFAPFGFDISVEEIFPALSVGARVVLRPDTLVAPDDSFLQLLREQHITIADLPTPFWQQWVLAGTLDGEGLAIRLVVVGGEKGERRHLETWKRSPLGRRCGWLHNYGPTEATVYATALLLQADDALPDGEIPIGRPNPNTRVYLLDAQRQPVPIGVAGEIWIGGAGITRGYLNLPDMTAERFIDDPFDAAGGRLYRTGDLARWREDRTLEFLGRNDFQVKFRGFRIELGEIEARLATCAGVREAVVIAREDGGDRRLVAYVVPRDGAELTAAGLRAELATSVADYMVPSAFVTLAALPMTANDKLDRAALPAPDDSAVVQRAFEAPRGPVEQAVAGIWQQLLKLQQVGRADHFFELGGHSLMALQMIGRLRSELGADIGVRDLFAQPTLAGFAANVVAAARRDASTITTIDRTQPIPLSFAQQRLWFVDRLDPIASRAFHMPAALRLAGRLDTAALQAALDRIVARHESLRTTFADVDGHGVQQIAAADHGFALITTDLTDVPADAREAAAQRISADEAAADFDLTRGPLIRGRLLRLAADEHVLLITQHHIVSDGWSVTVLLQELSALYAAFSRGEADPLPPLSVQYADFSAWQRGTLAAGEQAQSDFWLDTLRGAPELLALPTDRPRPATRDHAGGSVPLALSADISAAIRALAQRHGCTVFMTLLAAWSLLLSRLSGQHDVVVGTPVANRPHPDVEPLIGFFVNMLPLRVQLCDDTRVATLLAQVRNLTLSAYEHQDLPFEQIVDRLQPARSRSHHPLFQAMLSLNNTPGADALQLPGIDVSEMSPARIAAHFDLSLVLADDGDVLTGELVFARDLFDAATVERIGSQLDCLLTAMVADDGAQAGMLPLLDPPRRDQLLLEFNDTTIDYPRDALIHECFEAQAQRHPDAIALEYEGSTLSYAELDRRADRLAQRLASAGVQPRDRVAICAERSIELIVGLLAILKVGAAYVPIDPLQPPARLAFLLEDCAPAALLLQQCLDVTLPSMDVPRLMLGDVDEAAAVQSRAVRERQVDATDAAYIIYTSGSTGTPKGVVVSHRCVNRLVINTGYFTAGAGDCLAHAANPAFDAATWEIWGALLNGARVLILPQAVLLDTPALDRALVAGGVTALWMTVGLFNQAAEQMPQSLGRLRTLIVGGDALDPRSIRRLLQRDQRPAQVVNGYGPTETTTFACTHDIRDVADDATSIPIGRPIANTRIYILGAHREPVPIGVIGELFIGGDGVARGYWNQPELTAERFVDDPFSPLPQARMYRTGDLGRWRADGTIEFLGRNDFQVKIRGFRIELGEIEHRLAGCDGVREAVVVVREDTPGDKRLVAYVIADAAAGTGAAALREALSASLADYMIPSAFVFVSAFPLTANGKLDRQALPAPDDAAVARRAFSPPSGDTERAVAAVWQTLLCLDRVGRDDHFFEIGGHSLLALQLVSRLRSECGVEVGLRELFDHPTLAGFCARVDAARTGSSVAMPAPIPPADRSAPLPLSFAQQRLWFVDRLDAAAGAAYHMPSALRLRGRLDVDSLRASLDAIVARHEVLRTCFVEVDGQPVQRITDAGIGFALDCVELPTADGQDADVERLAVDEAARPFDLSTGPLIRGRLLRLGGDEHVLLLTQHHIISDGWSVAVLVRELAALYAAFVDGRPDPLPPLPLQYADFAAWQCSAPVGELLQAQAAYWKQTLSGAPEVLAMPTDRPRPPRQSHAGARVSFTLPPTLCDGLHALGRRHSTTLFMTLMAGWSALLSRLSGQTDVVIGTPVANRERSELEPLIGFFVNSLALRIDLDDRPSVATLLSRVKAATLGAFEHQALPFEHVVDLLQPTRSLAHSPLFQVMLSLNNTPGSDALVLPGLSVEPLESARDAAHFDLSLSLAERDGALVGDLVYATDLFDAATIERIAAQFQRLLAAMTADDRCRIDELPLIDDIERQHLLHRCNDTARDWPRDALIHSLFEQQAARRPLQAALQCGEQQLSYDQLNRRANRLAHRLVALGVRPDDRVAICAERSIEMVVGLLAILKAGGAYLPLDPGYPPERLAYMLDDATPVALLAQSAVLDRLPTASLPLLALDGVASDALAGPAEHDRDIDPAAIGLGPTHLAYVIYTSGSTGAAKGVMVEHRNVVQLCIDNSFAPIDADDCIVHCANPAFDASTWEIWGGLLNGARVLVVPQAVLLDPPRFADALADGGATASFLTVALFNQYADALSGVLPRMKHLLFGGEKTDLKQIKRVFRDCRPRHLVHCYGPTETTTFTTTLDIVALADDAQALPIGRPIGNSRIYILDGGGQPVPVCVPGEIHVGGDGVARGYLNRPELSAERFLDDPFAAGADARMYRTGDLARWLPDGTIEFLARNDSQVKIRGFRVELGEIECRLASCIGVREAVVVVREDSPGDKRLVAYVVADSTSDDEAPTAAGLRRELAAGLAEVMIPGAFVMLDALPLTPNGKLDRRALPAPDAASIVAREYEPPQGPVEQALADIWQQLLGIERVGRSDQFFELGGHSLMAVQLAGRIREQCHVEVALRDLFEQPVLAQLAERVTALQFEQFLGDDVEALENELAGLSEDELRAILASEGASIEQA